MTTTAAPTGHAGVLRFARYALAPNRLGYCGPTEGTTLFEHVVNLSAAHSSTGIAGATDQVGNARRLRTLAQGFEGAWPYLELIAGANGIVDPLDDRVVAAYWIGGPLLGAVGSFAAGNHVESRFRSRAGRWWSEVAAALAAGVLVNHAFHVMVVGPWVGMLRHGRSDAPLEVIDRCRIRRGRVLQLCGDDAIVLTDRISFDSGMLTRGGQQAGTTERVRLGEGGRHPCGPVLVGDTVAIHWDRVCEVLSPSAQVALSRGEAVAMDRANRALSVPGTPELG